jgi:hypothetical protein
MMYGGSLSPIVSDESSWKAFAKTSRYGLREGMWYEGGGWPLIFGQLELNSTAMRERHEGFDVRNCCIVANISESLSELDSVMLIMNGLGNGPSSNNSWIHARYAYNGWGEYPYELRDERESFMNATLWLSSSSKPSKVAVLVITAPV